MVKWFRWNEIWGWAVGCEIWGFCSWRKSRFRVSINGPVCDWVAWDLGLDSWM